MAYLVNTTPTLETIPQDIISFAVNVLGWSEINMGVVAAPGADAGVGFEVSYDLVGATNSRYRQQLLIHLVKDGVRVNSTPICVPYIAGAFQSPTRLHLFGGQESAPYLGVAIEFSPGFFRHGYLGYMEKIGTYGGGEITASSYFTKANTSSESYTARHKYPFSGSYIGKPIEESCARIIHPDVGGDGLVLVAAHNGRSAGSLVANRALGGFLDNINDGKLANGLSTFAGSSILIPINMYRTLEADRVQPIGRPAGVRMIRMDYIDVAQTISVGGKTWRCFPVFKKYMTTSVSTANYSDETSYIVGMAYLED